MIETVLIPTPHGPTVAALAVPKSEGPHPAILICHEWFGLNDEMRRMAERFAGEGFVALALDFYHGKSTTEASEEMQLVMSMQTDHALEVTTAAITFLHDDPRCNGAISITGFCLGGAMAIAAVCNVPGLRAAVPFYGLPLPKYLHFENVRAPLLGHYAHVDAHVPADKVEAVAEQARAAGVSFEVHFYGGGHGFMRKSDPQSYHDDSARLAWQRTIAFLKQHSTITG
jgi:carboxymethylenebutenolidase